jgi:hypothetical protein
MVMKDGILLRILCWQRNEKEFDGCDVIWWKSGDDGAEKKDFQDFLAGKQTDFEESEDQLTANELNHGKALIMNTVGDCKGGIEGRRLWDVIKEKNLCRWTGSLATTICLMITAVESAD